MGLRSGGIDVAEFRERFGCDLVGENPALIAQMESDGLIVRDGIRVSLTRKGILLCDEICSALMPMC